VLERLYSATLETRAAAAERFQELPEVEDEGAVPFDPLARPTEAAKKRFSEVFFDDFEEALAYDLQVLDTHLINIDSSSGRIVIRRDTALPLVALLTDAKVRYGLEGVTLFEYGAEALGAVET
jgi:hypothetical protein